MILEDVIFRLKHGMGNIHSDEWKMAEVALEEAERMSVVPRIEVTGEMMSAIVKLPLTKCPICGNPMLDLFTFESVPNLIEGQLKELGITFKSCAITHKGKHVCLDCKESVTFKCYKCNEICEMSQVQEAFGDPQDYLCKHCYERLTAKEWDAVCEHLENEHRYDYD